MLIQPLPAPVAETPVTKTPVTKTPVTKTPVTKTPVAKTPVAKTPVAEAPVAKAPVAEVPVAEVPVAEVPVAEAPVAETPVAETPVAETPGPALSTFEPSIADGSEPPIPNLIPLRPLGPGEDHSLVLPWVQPVMLWKDHIVIDRYGSPLPVDRCFHCNSEADWTFRRTFTSFGSSTLVFVMLLPLLLPRALRSRLPARSRATLEFGTCRRCAHRRFARLCLGGAALVAAIALLVAAFLIGKASAAGFVLGGVACLLFGAVTVVRASHFGVPKRIDERWIVLQAGGKAFRESLPESPIPQF